MEGAPCDLPKDCGANLGVCAPKAATSSDNVSTAEGDHIYKPPVKEVKKPSDMFAWEKSQAYYDVLRLIHKIGFSIQGKRLTEDLMESHSVARLIRIFEKLTNLIKETPPVDQPQRFGNQAFRSWHEKMSKNAIRLLQSVVPIQLHRAVPEISAYFIESFGNPTRIDYGTGHELAFIMFLCCLYKIGVLTDADNAIVGLKVFNAYIILARCLQVTYRMEPAGSHGVWSLDDYQFIPFIWGSAQFAIDHPINPDMFVVDKAIEKYKDDYMFISCIDYIRQVKTGHFAEHSNQLWSISAVQSWVKINQGLIKMYQKEVLAKFPVIQHVLFGSLMVLKAVEPNTPLPNIRLGIQNYDNVPMSSKNSGSGDINQPTDS